MEYVLQTRALCKNYGKSKVLSGLDMQVPKGAIYGLIGKNGAGKTTLIRLICGLQSPTFGSYSLYGAQYRDKTIYGARRRMGAVVETPSVYSEMSAEENIKEQYRVLGLPSTDGIDELLSLVGLGDTGKKKAKNFSLGMKQRLGIAVALAGNPDFLVLDEPINGLDPQGIVEIRELVLRLNREYGITVLISSHILDELAKIATHYGFLDGGRMVKETEAATLESACGRRTRAQVSDVKALARALDKLGAEYKIISDTHADIYTKISTTKLVEALSAEKCELLSASECDESLESYFMSLVGGEKHD